mmetsp:Transcript_11713/g.20830  ORF Transcript_11713/g.20830 Transcript_11713/m.20830 type:complete len:200 (-) Transcript_11713:560-1159(-)
MQNGQMPPFFPGMAPMSGPAPHSHLVCGGCQTLLMYPQGAGNVRCSRCQVITPAPPTAGVESAQLLCDGCRVLLSYPRGAQSVQCSMCHVVTEVPTYAHVVCEGCSIMLMFLAGAQSVKCSVCHHVTPANSNPAASHGPQGHAPQGHGHGPGPSSVTNAGTHKQVHTVVVENPPTLDEQGNEVANIAVGVKQQEDGNRH